MLFKKKFIKFIILLGVSQSAFASVVQHHCEKYLFQIEIINADDRNERQFNLYYNDMRSKKKLFYHADVPSLDASCIRDNKKNIFFIFQEYCGGNACSEQMYSVFDPVSQKMILHATDWKKGNAKEVEKLLGYQPPMLMDYEETFCCELEQYENK